MSEEKPDTIILCRTLIAIEPEQDIGVKPTHKWRSTALDLTRVCMCFAARADDNQKLAGGEATVVMDGAEWTTDIAFDEFVGMWKRAKAPKG